MLSMYSNDSLFASTSKSMSLLKCLFRSGLPMQTLYRSFVRSEILFTCLIANSDCVIRLVHYRTEMRGGWDDLQEVGTIVSILAWDSMSSLILAYAMLKSLSVSDKMALMLFEMLWTTLSPHDSTKEHRRNITFFYSWRFWPCCARSKSCWAEFFDRGSHSSSKSRQLSHPLLQLEDSEFLPLESQSFHKPTVTVSFRTPSQSMYLFFFVVQGYGGGKGIDNDGEQEVSENGNGHDRKPSKIRNWRDITVTH